jgi:enoyl-CoA hydratase/3-hydroxyacyl-CoA dehydrogenase
VGSDIGLHVGKNFVDSFPARTYTGHLIGAMVEARRLGEKSGAGFYKVHACVLCGRGRGVCSGNLD